MTNHDPARLMREFPLDKRNALIQEVKNCIDGRDRFRQRQLAKSYKFPKKPEGIA